MLTGCSILIGFILDLFFGDPYWLPHPVRLMGKAIVLLENGLRRLFPKNANGERMAGAILAVVLPVCSFAATLLLLWLCSLVGSWLVLLVQSLLCYQVLATKSLKFESMKVYDALKSGDLCAARYAVSMIVGRDTQSLDSRGIAKAAVETVAENTSDGVVAPLFYLMIGGAPLGLAYKAINTMYSMVGYKNEKYLHFGRIPAKLDDVANFLPARLSALFMILSAFLLKLDGENAWRIFKRDRFCHASPNSAQTEAVCAGALGLQLAGDASYFGKLVHKPTIGDALRDIEPEDIRRANWLLYATAILTLLFCLLVRFSICFVLQGGV